MSEYSKTYMNSGMNKININPQVFSYQIDSVSLSTVTLENIITMFTKRLYNYSSKYLLSVLCKSVSYSQSLFF